jgi:hypothetical protein
LKDENKVDFKKLVSDNWIEPPRRERKRKYAPLLFLGHGTVVLI